MISETPDLAWSPRPREIDTSFAFLSFANNRANCCHFLTKLLGDVHHCKTKNNYISRLIKVSSCITRSKQKALEELYQKQMLRRVESILSDSSHPLQAEFQMLPSGSPKIENQQI